MNVHVTNKKFTQYVQNIVRIGRVTLRMKGGAVALKGQAPYQIRAHI